MKPNPLPHFKTYFFLISFFIFLISCTNDNKNTQQAIADTANSVADTSVAPEDTATLIVTPMDLDTMEIEGTVFYERFFRDDLMLFTFKKLSGSHALIQCRSINGTVVGGILATNARRSNNMPGSFRLRPAITSSTKIADFLTKVRMEDGFDFAAHPENYRVILTGNRESIGGQAFIEIHLFIEQKGDSGTLSAPRLSTSFLKANPCPPC